MVRQQGRYPENVFLLIYILFYRTIPQKIKTTKKPKKLQKLCIAYTKALLKNFIYIKITKFFKNSDPKNWGVWADHFKDFTCNDWSTDMLCSDKYKQ